MQRLTHQEWITRFIRAHGGDYTYARDEGEYNWLGTCNHCGTQFRLDARRHVLGQHRCRCEATQRQYVVDLPYQDKEVAKFHELYGPKYEYLRFYTSNGSKYVEFRAPDGKVYRRAVNKHLSYDPYLTGVKAQ